MNLSRRTFLKSIGQAAAAQSLPRPILDLAESVFLPEAAAVATTEIPGFGFGFGFHFLTLGSGLSHFSRLFSHEKVFPDPPSEDGFHEIISDALDRCFPEVLCEAEIFRACNSPLMTGTRDKEVMDTAEAVYELRRNFCLREFLQLANRVPPLSENSYEQAGQFLELAELVRSNPDAFRSQSLKDLDGQLQRLATSAQHAGIVTREESYEKGWYNSGSGMPQIKSICDAVRLPVGGVNSLVHFASSSSCTSPSVFRLLDEKKLMEFVAEKVGEHTGTFISSLYESHGENFTPRIIDYITNEFEGTVQSLYQRHCAAIMPELNALPLPKISQEVIGIIKMPTLHPKSSVQKADIALEENSTAVAVEEGEQLSPAIRMIASVVANQGTGGQPVDTIEIVQHVYTESSIDMLRTDLGKRQIMDALDQTAP